MKINVTQNDIDNGIPQNPWSCPIANAIKREAIKREQNANVSVGTGRIKIDGRRWRTTKVMIKFIKDFDNGKIVKPHCFKI